MKLLKILKKYQHLDKKHVLSLIILIVVLIFSITIYEKAHQQRSAQELAMVSVATVRQQNEVVSAEVIGAVLPHATVAIKSLVDGELIKIGFNKGDFVKAGQVLFSIDPRPYQVALQQAQANLARDQAQLNAAISYLERNRKLIEQHFISAQDFDQLKANRDSLAATVAADQAQIANATLQLSYCTITAPIDGRVGDFLVDVGNVVKAQDQNPLVVINQITPVDVKFSISEKQFVILQKQGLARQINVQARLDVAPNVVKEGKIDFVDNTVDTQTGMIQLRAIFANLDHYFWPGQFVRIMLPLMNINQAVLVPTRAIQFGQKGSYVFVINKKDKKTNVVKIRPVKVGPVIDDQTVITSGLQPGELVVMEGQLNLTDGTKVRVQSSTINSAQ